MRSNRNPAPNQESQLGCPFPHNEDRGYNRPRPLCHLSPVVQCGMVTRVDGDCVAAGGGAVAVGALQATNKNTTSEMNRVT